MGWWVSARQRVRAPELVAVMQHNYFCNVTLYALGDVAVEEILRKPLAEVAAMVRPCGTPSRRWTTTSTSRRWWTGLRSTRRKD
jgi:hypothetical protein